MSEKARRGSLRPAVSGQSAGRGFRGLREACGEGNSGRFKFAGHASMAAMCSAPVVGGHASLRFAAMPLLALAR